MPRFLGEASAIRNLVKQVSGREISSEEAQKFLDVFGGDLEDAIVQTHKDFIAKHFGTRKSNL